MEDGRLKMDRNIQHSTPNVEGGRQGKAEMAARKIGGKRRFTFSAVGPMWAGPPVKDLTKLNSSRDGPAGAVSPIQRSVPTGRQPFQKYDLVLC